MPTASRKLLIRVAKENPHLRKALLPIVGATTREAVNVPPKVDEYYESVKKDNPSYDDGQAMATAWSIYCEHKNPGSPSCKQDSYFPGKKKAVDPLGGLVEIPKRVLDYMENIADLDSSRSIGAFMDKAKRKPQTQRKVMDLINELDRHMEANAEGWEDRDIETVENVIRWVEELLRQPWSDRRAAAPKYVAQMVHGGWIVFDKANDKTVAEGLPDVNAARQWIKDQSKKASETRDLWTRYNRG